MTVLDVIGTRSEVFSITEDVTVHDAARYLRDHEVRSVAVVNARGDVVGVISQSDISDKIAAENRCPAWTKVSDVMSTRLVAVRPDESVDDCLRLMDENGIYHLLVIDGRRRYRGMLAIRDLLRVRVSDEKARADLLEAFVCDGRPM